MRGMKKIITTNSFRGNSRFIFQNQSPNKDPEIRPTGGKNRDKMLAELEENIIKAYKEDFDVEKYNIRIRMPEKVFALLAEAELTGKEYETILDNIRERSDVMEAAATDIQIKINGYFDPFDNYFETDAKDADRINRVLDAEGIIEGDTKLDMEDLDTYRAIARIPYIVNFTNQDIEDIDKNLAFLSEPEVWNRNGIIIGEALDGLIGNATQGLVDDPEPIPSEMFRQDSLVETAQQKYPILKHLDALDPVLEDIPGGELKKAIQEIPLGKYMRSRKMPNLQPVMEALCNVLTKLPDNSLTEYQSVKGAILALTENSTMEVFQEKPIFEGEDMMEKACRILAQKINFDQVKKDEESTNPLFSDDVEDFIRKYAPEKIKED